MLTLTDLFAGAGGSSAGAAMAGVHCIAAANHSPRAVQVHTLNHPDAIHRTEDVHRLDPRMMPYSDILWASPSCTKHTQAQGKKRAADDLTDWHDTDSLEGDERDRATMWCVPRFVDRHPYRAIVVENVVDVAAWAPFGHWRAAIESFGYRSEVLSLNAAHSYEAGAPAPQSRDRLFVVFTRLEEATPQFDRLTRPMAHCADHGTHRPHRHWTRGRTIGKHRQQYRYACATCAGPVRLREDGAETVIDWSNLGGVVAHRTRPLAPSTAARIARGRELHGTADQVMSYYGATKGTALASEPLSTLTTKARHALVTHRDGLRMRMLTATEQADAMGFPVDYQWGDLTETERTHGIGNAVAPPVARDILTVVSDALNGGSHE